VCTLELWQGLQEQPDIEVRGNGRRDRRLYNWIRGGMSRNHNTFLLLPLKETLTRRRGLARRGANTSHQVCAFLRCKEGYTQAW